MRRRPIRTISTLDESAPANTAQGIQLGRYLPRRNSMVGFGKFPGGSGGSSVQRYRIEELQDGWLKCRVQSADGVVDPAASLVLVAKQPWCRAGTFAAQVSGWNVAVTTNERTLTAVGDLPAKGIKAGDKLVEMLRPEYAVGVTIYAASVNGSTDLDNPEGGKIQWLDIVSRSWFLDYLGVLACVDGLSKRVVVGGGPVAV